MSEGEVIAHAERSLAVVDQFPGGVVDGSNVVGVEGMSHTQGVGEHACSQTEQTRLRYVEMVVRSRRDQTPSDHVEGDDGEGHSPDGEPLPGTQSVAEFGQPAGVDGSKGSVVLAQERAPRVGLTVNIKQIRMVCNKTVRGCRLAILGTWWRGTTN